MTARDLQPLSTRAFFDKFLRVPDGGRLVPMRLHPEQERVLFAWDHTDDTGRPRYDEALIAWCKKSGKSTTAAGFVLAELVSGQDSDREIILCASDLQQSKDVVFAGTVRFIRRNQWLSKHVRILNHELVYKQTVTDPNTGGRHVEEHIARSVPARDARSLHGTNATLTVIDELWSQNNYEVLEALAASPARKYSRRLLLSYAGLRSQRHEGIPIFDYWERAKAGTDPRLLASFIEGEEGWRSITWIRQSFIDSQRRQFAAVPSKFRRLWLNEWTADDTGTFLTGEEIHAAIDPTLTEPERGESGIAYTMGVDLGLTFDWSAVVLSHIGQDHKLVIDAVRFWRGTRQRPVSIMAVEDSIIELSKRFRIGRCVLDQWQSQYLSERLNKRGLTETFTVAVDPSRLDRMATHLKRVFAARQIRIPQHAELIEQLETIIGVEQKRRDLVRFTSGAGQDAGRHDDLVVALCLSMESQAQDIGRAALPATFTSCYRAASVRDFNLNECFLMDLGGNYIPSGCPCCKACVGWQHVKQAYQEHQERGGEVVGLRRFRHLYVVSNDFVARVKANTWANLQGI